MKYKFIKMNDEQNPYDRTSVVVRSNAATLNELLEDFQEFLYAAGYNFDGADIGLIERPSPEDFDEEA